MDGPQVNREDTLPPTYLAMSLRKQWSDEHLFEENDLNRSCSRCGKRRGHSDHVSREEDRAAVKRWTDVVLSIRA
jgi:hypothetical protein